MQAVILAAGQSSRFYPFNQTLPHKSLLKCMGKPLIEHTLSSLKKSGIYDVIIVVGKSSLIESEIGDGKKNGIKITYCVQAKPMGQGDALFCAKDKIKSSFFLLHAHRVDFREFHHDLERKYDGKNIVLLARAEEDVGQYGVLKVQGDKVLDIVEKPKKGQEPSNLRLIGIYLLNKDFVAVLEKTPSEHYSLEVALATFAKMGRVTYVETKKESYSLKYPWDALLIKNYLFTHVERYISSESEIARSAEIQGNVHIEKGARILERACIKGPVFIGKNVTVGNHTLIRDNTDIESGSKIGAYTEVKNSLIGEHSSIHSGFIGDSIVGKGCRIGGFFSTANRRLDRKNITLEINGKKVDSRLGFLGAIVGDNVRVGVRVSTMPGVIIGNNAIIGASTTVMKNVGENTRYYTELKEIVEKKRGVEMTKKAKKKLVLFDIDYTLFDTSTFKQTNLQKYKVYKEVIGVLMELSKIARLGIFSEGDRNFQAEKIAKTNIAKHFLSEHVHIVPNKEETMRKVLAQYKHSQLFIVDDKLPFLSIVQQYAPHAYTIWVKRGIYAENQKPIKGFRPNATVKSLKSIVEIVANA